MNASEPEFETVIYDFEVFNGTTTREDLLIFRIEDVEEGDSGETSVTMDVELVEGNRYTWRTRARDLSGGAGPYEVVTFIVDVDNGPPPAPEIVGPDPEEHLPIGGSVPLQWRNSTDPDGDRVDYLGDVALDEDFVEIVRSFRADRDPINSTTSVVVPMTLEPETTYHWRVAATDTRYVSDFDVSTFQTAPTFRNTAPTAPVPISPIAGATFQVGETVELIVDNAVDPDENEVTYQFQVALDVTMRTLEDCPPVGDNGCAEDGSYCCEGSTIVDVPEGTDTTSLIHPDLRAINYFWRARAFDGVSSSPWSDVNGFTIDEEFILPDPDLDADAGLDIVDLGVDSDEVGPPSATNGQLGGGGGCGTAPGSAPTAGFGALALLALARRRRRQ
jgi:MYXO-CTERM domain-containing protein